MEKIGAGSYWRQTLREPFTGGGKLKGEVRADVAVVGAGITGLTAALHLKRAGRKVVVLEAGEVGSGTTGGTSGHLDAHPDIGARKLIDSFGEKSARLLTQSRKAAISLVERWCGELGLDAEFARIPAYYYTEDPSHIEGLRKEQEASMRLGLEIEPLEAAPLPFETAAAFSIANMGRFHSLKYINGLARAVQGDGCTIYENTPVKPPTDGTPCTVEAADGNGKVLADDVVLATHSGYLGISVLDTRVAPYQSYCLTVRVREEVEDALFWDDAEPYHYTRRADGDPHRLIVGGADHKTGQCRDERTQFGELEHYARQRYTIEEVEQRWSAEFFEPTDGVPYIGKVPLWKHVYVATGYSGTGLTWGTAAGTLIADEILAQENSVADLVSPGRIKLAASAGQFVSENLNVAVHWVTDRLHGRKVGWLEEITPGQGALVRLNGKQLAVYREPNGRLHTLNPTCTHAGCIVAWNAAEHTWDCPCHGGRYSATGERIYGPPPQDLKPVDVPQ